MARARTTRGTKQRANNSAPAYQVFVSHATLDKWLATILCELIERTGASTFRDDRDIDGGDDIPEKIRTEIKRSKEMVVLMTPHSIGRIWVNLEIGAAWGIRRGYRIIAVLEHVEVDGIPEMLQSKKAIQLNGFDAFLNELSHRVNSGGRKR